MAENGRKRKSKWDVMEDTHVPTETIQANPLPVKEDDSFKEKQSNLDWNSSNCDDNQFSEFPDLKTDKDMPYKYGSEVNQSSEWSELAHANSSISKDGSGRPQNPKSSNITADDTDGSTRSAWEPISGQSTANDGNMPESPKHPETDDKDGSKRSCWEPIPREKDGSGSRGTDEWGSGSRGTDGWGAALIQNRSMSPGFDAWRQPRCSNSPRSGRSQSRRSRSRSRSRSPSCGLQHGSERWADRCRMGGGSAGTCRDFTSGRCTRGSQCRYTHEDGGRRNFERGRSDSKENFPGSRESRDYTRDRPSERHGSRHEGNWEKPELRRNNRSTERCYDFFRGRCQRGSSCRYVHHDASSGGGWNMRDEAKERTRDRGDPDASFRRRVEPRRVSDLLCKYFSDGRCHRGEDCSFSHQGVPLGQSDRRPHDDDQDYNRETEYKSLRAGSNWGDQPQHPQSLNPQDNRHQMLPQDAPQKSLPSQEQNRETSGVTMVANNAGSQVEMNSTNHILAAAAVAGQNFIQSGQSQYMGPQPPHAQSFTPGLQIQQVVPQLPFDGHMQQIYMLPPNGQNQFGVPQAPQNPQSLNLSLQSHQVRPPPHIGQIQPNFNLSGQIQGLPPAHNAQGQPSFHLSGQIQQGLPLPHHVQSQQVVYSVAPNGLNQFGSPQPPNPQIFNSGEQSHQMAHQSNAESTQRAELSSDAPITPKVVSSEQAAQITNLSASLAQFFGNGPQLPQLYATLNPQSATGPAPPQPLSNLGATRPLSPAAAPPLQPTQGSQAQQQPGPIFDSTEPANSDSSNIPPGFSSASVEQKDPKFAESHASLKSSAPLSATGDSNADNRGNHEPDQVESRGNPASKEANDTETGQSKKEHSGHSENVDADGESNRSKDSKESRMFKCALVEFVKDVLKPAWKEGHLSKEVHKTIVKKVVEKVTGAMKGSSVPQTQEKIDLYLAYSKDKLNKLVQAYLEKYV